MSKPDQASSAYGSGDRTGISQLAKFGRDGVSRTPLPEKEIEVLVTSLGTLAREMPDAKPLADALYALAYLWPARGARREALWPLMTRLCAFADDVLPGRPGFSSVRASAINLRARVTGQSTEDGAAFLRQVLEHRQGWARERARDGYSATAGESPRPRLVSPPKSVLRRPSPPRLPGRIDLIPLQAKPEPWRLYFKRLCPRVPSEYIKPPPLDQDDERLIRAWGNGILEDDSFDLGRLKSARVAEKAMGKFYESLGCLVTDVALGQIAPISSGDWRLCDLRVGDQLIDVKNSRASFSQRSDGIAAYVEHCVPRFKNWRWGKPVVIAGALSPYIPAGASADAIDDDIQILGEITKENLDKMRAYFCCDDLLVIDFRRQGRQGAFLPPWVFEYPERFYSTVAEAERAADRVPINQWPSCDQVRSAGLSPLAVVAICQEPWPDHWPRDNFDEVTLEFSDRLRRALGDLGRSRPVIWIAILRFVLEIMGRVERVSGWSPEKLLPVIFLRKDNLDRPLELYDPLQTISSLVSVLDVAWKYLDRRPLAFKQYQVASGAILRARGDAQDPWTTMVAYCGGWKTYSGCYPDGNVARCGRTPLYLGMHETCPNCFHLICDVCGFCKSDCSLVDQNQLVADQVNRTEAWGVEASGHGHEAEDVF